MIGSFWNLCRACPSMPVEKQLHSEYRSTFKWHEYTGPRPDVVRHPPQPTGAAGILSTATQPVLPRKKKHPEFAYRTNEWNMSNGRSSTETNDAFVDRARSEERSRFRNLPSRRSRSEGPPSRQIPQQSEYRLQFGWVGQRTRQQAVPLHGAGAQPDYRKQRMISSYPPPSRVVLGPSLTTTVPPKPERPLKSSEYRLQFAWPRSSEVTPHTRRAEPAAAGASSGPRKSLSMGAIRPVGNPVRQHEVTVSTNPLADLEAHIIADQMDVSGHEPDSLGYDAGDHPGAADETDGLEEQKIVEENQEKGHKKSSRVAYKSEYRKKFRPFSQYEYVDGRFQKKKGASDSAFNAETWYKEVVELRKQAGEYRHRGWCSELAPDHISEIYNKQQTVWEQVSQRSTLSALSLAAMTPSLRSASFRSITKEEKERENSRKSSPTKPSRPQTAPAKHLDEKPSRKEKADAHRDKSKDAAANASHGKARTSPPKPRALHSVTKASVESKTKSNKEGRSQSVGPDVRSPKRQTKQAAATAAPGSAGAPGGPGGWKVHLDGPAPGERRPRPTSLTTTTSSSATFSRPKSSTAPLKADEGQSHHHAAKPTKHTQSSKSAQNGIPQAQTAPTKAKVKEATAPHPPPPDRKGTSDAPAGTTCEATSTAAPSIAPVPASMAEMRRDLFEPVVKSPPEPTRVKSPEQIVVRSPDPVNWTVPLDTGKTFTVTQNVREGDSGKPYLEHKHPTPTSTPGPRAPSSASATPPATGTPSTPTPRSLPAPTQTSASIPSPLLATSASSVTSSTSPSATTTTQDMGSSNSQHSAGGKPGSGIDPMTMSMTASMMTSSFINGFDDKRSDTPSPGEEKPASMPSAATTTAKPPATISATPTATTTTASAVAKPVAGTTLRSLEDPTFMFDPPASSTAPTASSRAPFRVLEAPTTKASVPSTITTTTSAAAPATSTAPTATPPVPAQRYRVLEDPGVPSDVMYQPAVDPPPYTPYQTTSSPAPSSYMPHYTQVSQPQPPPPPYHVLEAPELTKKPSPTSTSPPEASSKDSKPPALVSPSSGRAMLEKARTRFDKFWGKNKDSDKEGKV